MGKWVGGWVGGRETYLVVRVANNGRAPRAHIVHVFVAVHVPGVGTLHLFRWVGGWLRGELLIHS